MNIYIIKYAAGARLLDVSSDFGTMPNFESSILDPQRSSNDQQQPRIRYATYHLPWAPLDIPDVFTDDEKAFYQKEGSRLGEVEQEGNEEKRELHDVSPEGNDGGGGSCGGGGAASSKQVEP